ncbi:MAG: hypothetical protein ACRDYY_12530 [Acidimicrobiales bacterium]
MASGVRRLHGALERRTLLPLELALAAAQGSAPVAASAEQLACAIFAALAAGTKPLP